MDLYPSLQAALSQDLRARSEAEQLFKRLEEQNLPEYLLALSFELSNPEHNPLTRRLAGLSLKNALDAKDEELKERRATRWRSLSREIKAQIKSRAVQTFGDANAEARLTAAQVVSRIAIIELPQKEWPELIEQLVKNMVLPNPGVKQATLEALGFICEETEPGAVKEYSNQILTAVVQGMRKEETSNEVRLAGTHALLGALEFVRANFDKENEKNYIMQVVCEATQGSFAPIRVVAFQCLVRIAGLYYDKLASWMQNIFNITLEAIGSDQEEVALQAIEFWATICDVETDILLDIEELQAMKLPPDRVCQNFAKGALKFLLPILCEALTKQEEDQDEDAWNVSTAAGKCISLLANTVQDDVVEHVMPFVQKNINNAQNWRYREAAILAFGSILEGPRGMLIKELVREAVQILHPKLKDSVELVKDTTAWTLGRICEFHAKTITNQLPQLIPALGSSLADVPRVAAKSCWAIHNLAESYADVEETGTTPLSPYFQTLLEVLIQTTDRQDAEENYLRPSAYETVNVLIQNSGKDCAKMVQMLVPVFLERLQATFTLSAASAPDREKQSELQGHLCGALQACTSSLGADIKRFSDKLMEFYLKVFESKSFSVHEEALMAVGALANAVEADFIHYMQPFGRWLEAALRNWEEHQVCSIAVGVVGDICRALGELVLPYCDHIVEILLENLRNSNINRDVKPPILSCFGDIALAISGKFERYLSIVVTMLQQASATAVKDPSDYDFVDYVNQLREDIFEAYTAIIQGLRTDNKAELFLPHVELLVTFVGVVWNDNTKNDAVIRGAVGVLGDLAHALGGKVKRYLHNTMVETIVGECAKSSNQQTKDVANWAREVIRQL